MVEGVDYLENVSGIEINGKNRYAARLTNKPLVNLVYNYNATEDIPILGTSVTVYDVALGLDDYVAEEGTGANVSGTSEDYLFAKAFSLVALSKYDQRVLLALTNIICAMSEGEIVQNRQTFIPSTDEQEYFSRIAKKTADFIAASCQLGGIIAELNDDEIAALYEYGYSIGMAFQVIDWAAAVRDS